MVCMYVRMLYILLLCPVLLASSVLTLTIDSQLGTSIEDCFERISIGEQLPRSDIYRNVSELTTIECEQICKQDKKCQAYDYGVGAKGNATCDLSNLDEKEIKEKNLFQRNPDYDVYVRRFQCEQSPPTPIEKPFDGEGPEHRPIFRPDEEAKRPLADDLNPYESNRPQPSYVTNRPYPSHNERPDDNNNSIRPDDRPPSYGDHKPQEIPYRPERPFKNSTRPDPYDQLYFQQPNRRPRPGLWRPDPYHPPQPGDEVQDIYGPKPNRPKPDYFSERPQYQYIIRPNRKPYKPDDGYNQQKPDYASHDSYGPRPDRPYKPTRPYDKPSYSYTDQYASNYGTSQDNSIHVEIYDPPRPYRPNVDERPYYGSSGQHYGQNYGYNSFSAQNSYSQSQAQYGATWGHGYNGHRPEKPIEDDNVGYGNKPYKPKPSYSQGSYNQYSQSLNQASYAESYNHHMNQGNHYGNHEPQSAYSKPSNQYSGQHNNDNYPENAYGQSGSQGNKYGSVQSGYGNLVSNYEDSQYGSQSQNDKFGSQNGYGNHVDSNDDKYGPQSGYGNQVTTSSLQNQYGSSQSSYGNQASSTSTQNSNKYDSQSGYANQPSSSSSQSGYGNSQSGYGNQPSSSSSQNGYGNSQSGYGNQPSSSSSQSGYGNSQSGHGNQASSSNTQSGYGSSQNSYGIQASSSQSGYGSSQNSYGNQASSSQNGYGGSQSNYGNQAPSPQSGYGSSQIGYGNQATSSLQSGYGSSQSGYGNQESTTGTQNSYGNQVSNPQSSQSGYNNQASNSYGSSNGNSYSNFDNQNYYGSHLGYGIHHLYGIKPGSYGTDPNQDYRPIITDKDPYIGYKKPNQEPNGHTNQDGYIKPDVKPVYEPGVDKANGYNDMVTSKPVAVSNNGYGRNPGVDISYKACFKRVLAGKRALRSHVRRVVDCERLEDCRRECATERRFHCESFNYRLDPSFRGKGLCELMTKPIEAFDLRQDFVEDKDYDFYEIDRNSLEPYCPETLRGPGLLHSGYLSSKPKENQWRDRVDYSESGYKSVNRFYDERRTETHNRRYEDQFYIPYQIGIKTNDDQEKWGQYGGVYGGVDSYYKDRNDYHKSISHWKIPDQKPYTGVKHYNDVNDFNYHSLKSNSDHEIHGYGYGAWKKGQWNSSGSFWKDFERDDYHYKHGTFEFEGRSDDTTKDCSSRRSPGMSLGSGAIRRSLYARTVVECEAACFSEKEFKCVSYSYRYSSPPASDNCFLSERPYQGLPMSADSGSDVYAMPLHHDCLTVSTKPWVESECFWHVRSGSAVTGAGVRAALTVTGLGACEAECIRAHSFFCRGFSFRFDPPTIGDDLENCLLTSSPPTSLELSHGLRPSKHELYSRGNYGRGCEPALYDDVNKEPQCYLQYSNSAKLSPSAVRGSLPARDERTCGNACTDAPFRCLSFSYSNKAGPDIDNCLLSEIRLFDLQRGVDYEHSDDDLLFAFDLFNGQCWRKVHGKQDYDVPTLELPHPLHPSNIEETFPGSVSGPGFPPPPETHFSSSGETGPGYFGPIKPYIPETGPGYKPPYEPTRPIIKPAYEPDTGIKPIYLPDSGPETGPSGPSGPGPLKPYSRPDYDDSGYKPSYLRPLKPEYDDYRPNDNRPSYKPDIYRPGYKPDNFGPSKPDYRPSYRPSGPYLPSASGPSGPSSGSRPSYGPNDSRPESNVGFRPNRPSGDRVDDSLSLSWRHYTVSGFPCRKGSSCEQNVVAGHWACEPEGGEVGSWDYCCAPTHRCGYSEGFRKPWCYVGPSPDQWRPCSEKYYPYHQHNVPHPSLGHTTREAVRPRPDRPIDKPITDNRETYLPEADRRYWDDLYKNGPQAYYDKHGNPLPGYTRVPIEERPHIKYQRNPPRPGSGQWVPVNENEPPAGLGAPRYWPVAYLHKGPPPNMTYFKYNETEYNSRALPDREQLDFKRINLDKPVPNDIESRSNDAPRAEKRINITNDDDDLTIDTTTTTTSKPDTNFTIETTTEKEIKANKTEFPTLVKPENANLEETDFVRGIDGKLHDFTRSLEIFDIEDVKCDKTPDKKYLEAEEKQIEAIGRLIASRRGGKLILEKRSQKDLESKSIALDKDYFDFNFGNRFPTTERRGVIQKVSKDDIKKEFANDKSLEVSETTFVRPRVLSTTENIKKAVVNGKVFYDATLRDQSIYNNTRRSRNLRLEENRGPVPNGSTKKKNVRTRNTNPIRRTRRVYRKRYNPEEVRKRLLEREKNKELKS